MWENGIQKIPRKIRVHSILHENIAYSELIGTDIILPSKEEKEKKESKLMEKLQRIQQGREERKKMSIQEELDESGTIETEEVPVEETPKEEPKKEEPKPEEK